MLASVYSLCLNLGLGFVDVFMADEYVESPEGQKRREVNTKRSAWESLWAKYVQTP